MQKQDAGPASDADAAGGVDPTPKPEPEGPIPQAQDTPRSVEDPRDPEPLDYAPSSSQPDSAALQESGQVSLVLP